jgi:hypothetical protein
VSETPDDLLLAAQDLLDQRGVAGWQRAVAVLARQALESAVDDIWREWESRMTAASWRSKLIALPQFVAASTANDARSCWESLSGVCHVRQYDLPPTDLELEDLLAVSRRTIGALLAASVGEGSTTDTEGR